MISDCGIINNPPNGQVHLTNHNTTYGSSATFSCDTGYSMYTSTNKTETNCTENDSWSTDTFTCTIRGQKILIPLRYFVKLLSQFVFRSFLKKLDYKILKKVIHTIKTLLRM